MQFDMKKYILTASFLAILGVEMRAQTINYGGFFPTIDHAGKISSRINYSLYYFGQYLMANSNKEKPQLFAFFGEQALSYQLNTQLSFTGSYVFEHQKPYSSFTRYENRFYLQSTYNYKVNETFVKQRLRFDGRFIKNNITKESPFTSRIRYLVGFKKNFKNENFYLSGYNEFFFNTYKSATNIFDENWMYLGIGKKINTNNNLEIGPLYIFWITNQQNDFKNFLHLQLTWVSNLDFTKKQ